MEHSILHITKSLGMHLPTFLHKLYATQGKFLRVVWEVWIHSYHTKVKELNLPYYFSVTGGRIIGIITFSKLFVLYEIQTAYPRIWTWFAVSISYDNNHYATSTWLFIYLLDISYESFLQYYWLKHGTHLL